MAGAISAVRQASVATGVKDSASATPRTRAQDRDAALVILGEMRQTQARFVAGVQAEAKGTPTANAAILGASSDKPAQPADAAVSEPQPADAAVSEAEEQVAGMRKTLLEMQEANRDIAGLMSSNWTSSDAFAMRYDEGTDFLKVVEKQEALVAQLQRMVV